MDKGGIRTGHLDHGYLPHPTSMRKVIQDWSIRRTDRSRGYMQPYRELGNELDKNYDYERILSTSRGSSGSSGSITERISAILYSFVGHVREARELGRAYLHAAWQGKDWPEWLNEIFFFSLPCVLGRFFFFLYIGNSVFVDPIRGPDKTLSKNE